RLPAGRPALSAPDLRALLVDRPGRQAAPAPAHWHTAGWHPGLRVHHEPRRADGGGPVHHRLLGALLAIGDGARRRLRSISSLEGRLRRARDGLDSSLAEANGLHLS